MTFGEVIRDGWYDLTTGRRLILIAAGAVIAIVLAAGWISEIATSIELRKYERQAAAAKRESEDALKKAAAIAREKLTIEKRVAELEVQIDGRTKEANDARIKTLDARADYDRTLREQRGDNPGTDELCRELAALGYPCG
jgi:S-adenosylhomocysteine hydrolase